MNTVFSHFLSVRQLQVTVPKGSKDITKEVLEDYSSDISSSEAEKNEEKVIEFTATVDSDEIDELTEDLKSLDDIDVGELSIRVLEQESLIQKGQKTKGSSSELSQEELYSKAQEFSGFSRPQWGLIGLSSAIAAYGIALDNVIVVIGAMMLAPMLSPFVSAALSLAVGDKQLLKGSLLAGVESIVIAVIVSTAALTIIPLNRTAVLDMIIAPGFPTIMLSLLVGAAAALTFTTGLRDQIAGVAVAIALVPPLAAVGVGLNLQDYYLAAQSASIALQNALSIIVAGFAAFKILGVKPSTYYKKKEAEKLRPVVTAAIVIMFVVSVPITFISYQSHEPYSIQKDVEKTAGNFFGEDLVSVSLDNSKVRALVVGNHSEQEFRQRLPEGLEVNIVELQSYRE
ncbi:TIGR00341 family protein [Candidatus Nanohaloarchaea archaeon]|nr:TIGR00341 family protein [Candidatus Nanohaloarchaea archaeon]